ncbi:MAG: TolC family protein [Candidatus Aminicenantes bacterium]|nr:TolC family protein [Candidatus Aminicenantes bacterium]
MRRIAALIASLAVLAALPVRMEARPGQGPETLTLTLDDSIRLALRQNLFYLAEKAKEDGASAAVREAVSGFFPTLNAQGQNVLDKKVFSVTFPSFVPGQPPTKVKLDFTRNYQFSLNFSLPLYAGGRLMAGFKQANLNLQSTQEGIRLSQQETVFNVKKAFYGVLLARAFVDVTGEAVDLADRHVKNVRNLYEAGMATRFDMLRSEVQSANLKPQLIRARNGLRAAELGLKTLLGLDLNQAIEVKGELSIKAVDVNVDENIARALAQRPEVNQLRYQKLMAAEMVKMAKAAYLPTLAVGGAYNYWADKLNFGRNTWESFYQINMVLSFPIFNGFVNSARLGQSQAALKQIDYSQRGLAETVKFEVQTAILGLQQARESLLSQEKNVEQALEAVRIAELNFTEGLVTNLDVSSVQVALSEARTNYTQALYDYAVAMAELEKAVGLNQDAYEK